MLLPIFWLSFLLAPTRSTAFTAAATRRVTTAMSALSESDETNVACFCGAVKITAIGPPTSGRSFCHCSICRKLSGAPFSANGLWPSDMVRVEAPGGVHTLSTSKQVERCRCASCFSPVYAKLSNGKLTALPLASFTRSTLSRPGWCPTAHLHYGSRVIDMHDAIPKYAGAARGPLWEGDRDEHSSGS